MKFEDLLEDTIGQLDEAYFIKDGPARRYNGIKTRIISEEEASIILDKIKELTRSQLSRPVFAYSNDPYKKPLAEINKEAIRAVEEYKLPPTAVGPYELDQWKRQLRQSIDKRVGDYIKSKIGGDFVKKALSLYGKPISIDAVISRDDIPEHKKLEFVYVVGADSFSKFLNTLDAWVDSLYRVVK